MTQVTTPPIMKPRYYLNGGTANPTIDLTRLTAYCTLMFIHWTRWRRHQQDFNQAMEHVATGLYVDYLLMGAPDLSLEKDTVVYATPTSKPAPEQGRGLERFYDESSDLNWRIDTEEYRLVLLPHIVHWIGSGYHPRDFSQAVKDVASTVCGAYSLSCSFGGLGGGWTAEEFLNQVVVL